MRTLAMPEVAEPWSLTGLREKLFKIGAKVVRHGRSIIFQIAELAVPRQMFRNSLSLIGRGWGPIRADRDPTPLIKAARHTAMSSPF
jgi:hypothetical protein